MPSDSVHSEQTQVSAHIDPFGLPSDMPGAPVAFSDPFFKESLEMAEAGVLSEDRKDWLIHLQSLTEISDGSILPNPPSSIDVAEWDRFREIHLLILRWTTPWGGVSAWTDSFESIFFKMCKKGRRAVTQWLKAIWGHAETGKRLLDLLRTTNLPLPDDPVNTQLLWTKKMEATEILVKGIMIIETRYNIMGRGVFGIPGEPMISSDEEDDSNNGAGELGQGSDDHAGGPEEGSDGDERMYDGEDD